MTFETIDITRHGRADADQPRPPLRRRRAGVRRDVRERPGRAAHRLPVPRRQPARRHRARHRRPVRAGARLVHVRRRRPDVALQRQRRRAEDADPAPHPLGRRRAAVQRRGRRGALDVLDTEISPELVPAGDGEQIQSQRGQDRAVPAAGLPPVPRAALGVPAAQGGVPRVACVARRRRTARGRRAIQPDERLAFTLPEIKRWLGVFLQRFYSFASSSARRCRTARRSSAGGSLSPRGDWRAPSDMSARTWLDALAREVPDT